MGKFGAIQKNFFNDPFEIKKKNPPAYHLYEIFLYEDIHKGAMPKYRIRGCKRKAVEYYADDIMAKENLKSLNRIQHWMIATNTSIYDPPICINEQTGEVF